jgi:plastocyanin
MKRGTLAASFVALTFLMVGCSSSKSASTPTTAADGGGGGVTIPAADGAPLGVQATDQSATAQSFVFDKTTIAAGKVTITFVNKGNRQHELILLKTDTAADALVVDPATNKVSEDASVGEISETDAGKTVVKTFDLKPGKYVFVCNIEKHYGQGMRQAFTVTG